MTQHRSRFGALAGLVLAVFACSSAAAATTAPPVPAKYKTEYNKTAASLSAYAKAIHAMPNYTKKPAGSRVGWVELLAANGHRQTSLLLPSTMTLVTQSLDAFKRLGVGGVVLGVKLPLLLPQYTSQAGQYTQFYAKVAAAARARGLKVDVELGALFCGSVYAPDCSYKYGTTVGDFAQLTAQQARTVIDKVRPDYLDLISEPDTEASLTGIKDLQTVNGFSAFVSATLQAIGAHGATKLVAGAASWFPPAYNQAIIHLGIDALVVHIYPATAATAAYLVADSRIAHDAGKPVLSDEAWLFKGPTGGGAIETGNEQGELNCFSFWQPLDLQFIHATREWAAKTGALLMSGFYSWQDFAYSKWTPALDALSSAQVQGLTNQASLAALKAGKFTDTGLALVGRK